MTAPEFSRPERLDTIGDQPRDVMIAADPAERAALAVRFGLVAIDRLAASFAVRRDAGGVRAEGRVTADVVQSCVATGEPLTAAIDEPVALRFVAEEDGSGGEVELGGEQLDTIGFTGGAIDLGEAAAETMALALDPFPRAPDADATLRGAGVLSEGEAGPFGALAALRDRLGGAQSS